MPLVYGTAKAMVEKNTNINPDNSYDVQVTNAAKRLCEVYEGRADEWLYRTHWSSGTTLWENTRTHETIMVSVQGKIER